MSGEEFLRYLATRQSTSLEARNGRHAQAIIKIAQEVINRVKKNGVLHAAGSIALGYKILNVLNDMQKDKKLETDVDYNVLINEFIKNIPKIVSGRWGGNKQEGFLDLSKQETMIVEAGIDTAKVPIGSKDDPKQDPFVLNNDVDDRHALQAFIDPKTQTIARFDIRDKESIKRYYRAIREKIKKKIMSLNH